MSRQTVLANGVAWEVSPDDRRAEAERLWAVVTGRVIDELTGEAPRVALRIAPRQAGLLVRAAAGAHFALAARPWYRFPPLAAPAYAVDVDIEAAGYLPLRISASIPSGQLPLAANAGAATRVLALAPGAGLFVGQILLVGPAGPTAERCTVASLGPAAGQVTLAADLVHPHALGDPVVADAFVPVDLGALPLRRRPLVLRGRTVARTAAGSNPVPGATVALTRLWRTTAEVRGHLPPVAANIAGIWPGVYLEHGATSPVTRVAPATPAGEDKRLGAPAAAASTELDLSDSVNLVAGTSVIALDPGDPARIEEIPVLALAPALAPLDPVRATLRFPLRREHLVGAQAVRILPGGAVGPAKQLADAALPGDQTLLLDDLAGLAAGGTLRLAAGASTEYQQYALYRVTSDTDGYFTLPPLHRAAQVEVEAAAAGHPDISAANNNAILVQPDYGAEEAWLDLVFDS